MSELPFNSAEVAKKNKPDRIIGLLELVDRYRKQELVSAPHQRRPDVWNKKQRRAWIERLDKTVRGGEPPLGVFCLYFLTSKEEHREFLNDGLQRVASCADALRFPGDYGYKLEDITHILKLNDVTTQNRIYDNHSEAREDFALVNKGTGLTKSELHNHHLIESPNWTTVWKEQIELFRKAISDSLATYCVTTPGRQAEDSEYRTDLMLFSVAQFGRPLTFGMNDSLWMIVKEVFDKCSPSDIRIAIKKINAFSAEIEAAWRKISPRVGDLVSSRLARWLLGVRLYQEHCLGQESFSPLWWATFYEKLFEHTGGSVNIQYKNDNGQLITLNMASKLYKFAMVIEKLELEIPESLRRKRGKPLKAGFVHDHIESFADHGEGETVPMPTRLNAAKSARESLF
jgi:hypothetical protein